MKSKWLTYIGLLVLAGLVLGACATPAGDDSAVTDLQAQLEGTENRIAVERRKFNDTTRNYNTYIRRFPALITASIFGFDQKAYFEAAEGTETPPTVEF